MKNFLFATTLIVFLISACSPTTNPQISEDQVLLIRNTQIIASASKFNDPTTWNQAPQTCQKSMLKVWLTDPNSNYIQSGSGSLLNAQKMQNNSGQVIWMYQILTSNHVVKNNNNGQILNGKVVIYPKDYQKQDLVFSFLDYHQVIDDQYKNLDSEAIITIIGLSNLLSSSFQPIGIDSIVADSELRPNSNATYYTFDRPAITDKSQFTVSNIKSVEYIKSERVITLRPVERSSTVSKGSSGGAVCNKDGQIIGVVSLRDLSDPINFKIEANPSNIQQQILDAIQKSNHKLQKFGYQPTP